MVHKAEKGKPKCEKCGSGHVDLFKEGKEKYIICLDCGFENERHESTDLS